MDFLTKKELSGFKNDIIISFKEIEAEKKNYEKLLKKQYESEINDYFNNNDKNLNKSVSINEKKKKGIFQLLREIFKL